MKTFEELGVCSDICRAIEELGFEHPMPIQETVIPLLNSYDRGTDIIALAQTGTGKTAAFGLPLLQMVEPHPPIGGPRGAQTQAIVLSPTRELCLQIADDLRDFSKYMKAINIVAVYGGTSIRDQISALRHGAQIIVATPGRLIDLMERGKVDLSMVNKIVLDEADEMLNMGFSDSINTIFEAIPDDRQVLLFSATMSKEVEKVAKSYLRDYREVVVGSRNEGAEHVNHIYYMVNAKDKYLALKRIVDYFPRIYGIVFCRTKVETQEVADKLIKDGYNAEALHGDLSQQQRDLTMQKFRQHLTQLLVATDVAARGLDVDDLTHVINYAMPDDTESYTHRSGRTGRAGKKGTSIAIIHSRERHKIRDVEKAIGKSFNAGKLPTPQEICTKQLFRAIDEIEKTDVIDEQIEPFMTEIRRHFEYVDKEDILKKVVSREFGRFLAYYANAPEIEEVKEGRRKRDDGRRDDGSVDWGSKKPREGVQKGYSRLFINLGKNDGFYPGEVMQFINRNTHGARQQVGHIDLMPSFCTIEVPERDAKKLIRALNGAFYHNKKVLCKFDGGKTKGGSHSPQQPIEEGSARRKPKKSKK
jgi:ATP-dependent RNA helicase DeaD